MANPEYFLQTHIIKRHAEFFPHVVITHVPNRPSGQTDQARKTDAFFKKEMGVRAGVSDIVLWWGYDYPSWALAFLVKMKKLLGFSFARMHSGVVELKIGTDPSRVQNKFLSSIHALGGRQGVARSWEQYYQLLCSWGIKPVSECRYFDEPIYATKEEKFKANFELYRPI